MNWSRFWYDWLINLIVVVGFAWWFRIITCLCEKNINILIFSEALMSNCSNQVLHCIYCMHLFSLAVFFLPFPYGKSTNAYAFPLKHIFCDSQSDCPLRFLCTTNMSNDFILMGSEWTYDKVHILSIVWIVSLWVSLKPFETLEYWDNISSVW